ncbi:major facilitator superfamily domain-containing protein 6-like isoform X2 [Oratosquilla oratoria]
MGTYPLMTFLTMIIRQRGVSPEGIGLIWTFMPVTAIIIGTLLSTLVDYLSIHKSVFLITNLITPVALSGVYWTQHVGTGVVDVGATNLTFGENSSLVLEHHILSDDLAIDKNQKHLPPLNESREYPGLQHEGEAGISGEALHSAVAKNDEEIEKVTTKKTALGQKDTSSRTFSIPELLRLPGFWVIVTLVFMVQASNFMSSNLSEAICYMLLGKNTKDYGRQKVSSCISFGVCALATGSLIDLYSMNQPQKDYLPGFIMVVVFSVFDMAASSRMDVPLPEKKTKTKTRDFFRVFIVPKNILFFVTAIVLGTSVNFLGTFHLLLVEDVTKVWDRHFTALSTLQGLIVSCQAFFGEVPVMIFSGDILQKIGTTWSITLVLFCHGLRYVIYYTIDNPWFFLPIELLHGITYGLNKAALTLYVNEIAPKGAEATMFAVFKATQYVGKSLSGLVGGILWVWLGGSGAFLVTGVFILFYTVFFGMASFVFPKCCCTKSLEDTTDTSDAPKV